ncbi:MAG: hypothetical protein Q9208_001593 [Pyrenodesmia sp. 3 TL-2023]
MEEGKSLPQSHVQEVNNDAVRPSFGAKLKAHFRKWIYVAVPRISQDGVNDSILEIQSLTLSNPTATSFHLEQDALLTNHNKYHPRLDAFNASLSVGGAEEEKPYAYIQLPAVHATETTTTHIDQVVQITDMDAFVDYNTQLLTKESVDLVIKGRTKLHQGRLPVITVDYHKTITMKGIVKLSPSSKAQSFNITSFSIKLIPEPDGANMVGTIYIPNPSVMTITMGNVTFNNYVDGDFIGTSTLSDLVLRPGNNTLPMRSTVNQTLVIGKVTAKYQDGLLPVDIVGNSSVYEGQHLEYFEKALQSNRQHIVLDVGAALAAVRGGGGGTD